MYKWYYWAHNKEWGPYRESELVERLLSKGRLPANACVRREGTNNWEVASNLPELSLSHLTSDPEVQYNRVSKGGDSLSNGSAGTDTSHSSPSITNEHSSNKGLWEDIKEHTGEVYQKGDASAGFKLLQEVLGVASVLLLLANLELLVTGGRTTVAMNNLMVQLFKTYTRLDSDQRRQVRAWVSVARTGFGLFGK